MEPYDITHQGILLCCPGCASENIWRVPRSETEKLAFFLSSSQYAVKKYFCYNCRLTMVLHNSTNGIDIKKANYTYKEDVIPYIVCSSCKAPGLVQAKIEPVEEELYKQLSGKTAFKKIICPHCGNENIISREEYDQTVGTEL